MIREPMNCGVCGEFIVVTDDSVVDAWEVLSNPEVDPAWFTEHECNGDEL